MRLSLRPGRERVCARRYIARSASRSEISPLGHRSRTARISPRSFRSSRTTSVLASTARPTRVARSVWPALLSCNASHATEPTESATPATNIRHGCPDLQTSNVPSLVVGRFRDAFRTWRVANVPGLSVNRAPSWVTCGGMWVARTSSWSAGRSSLHTNSRSMRT